MRYQNVYLLQVRHIIRDGGPWASPVLEGILKEVEQQQEEGGLFFFFFTSYLWLLINCQAELLFLLYSGSLSQLRGVHVLRVACTLLAGLRAHVWGHDVSPEVQSASDFRSTAVLQTGLPLLSLEVLSKRTSLHGGAFSLNIRVTCAIFYFFVVSRQSFEKPISFFSFCCFSGAAVKMAEIDGKDAVEILCIAENEEKDELLLELSRGFLLQQLRSGDMYYLWWVPK